MTWRAEVCAGKRRDLKVIEDRIPSIRTPRVLEMFEKVDDCSGCDCTPAVWRGFFCFLKKSLVTLTFAEAGYLENRDRSYCPAAAEYYPTGFWYNSTETAGLFVNADRRVWIAIRHSWDILSVDPPLHPFRPFVMTFQSLKKKSSCEASWCLSNS